MSELDEFLQNLYRLPGKLQPNSRPAITVESPPQPLFEQQAQTAVNNSLAAEIATLRETLLLKDKNFNQSVIPAMLIVLIVKTFFLGGGGGSWRVWGGGGGGGEASPPAPPSR